LGARESSYYLLASLGGRVQEGEVIEEVEEGGPPVLKGGLKVNLFLTESMIAAGTGMTGG
jgi:hypothetical protein